MNPVLGKKNRRAFRHTQDPKRTFGRFVVPARSGLSAPLSDGLDMAKADIGVGISDISNLRDCGSCLIVRVGGVPDLARRATLKGIPDGQDGRATGCKHLL